jgi:hypothetical protein
MLDVRFSQNGVAHRVISSMARPRVKEITEYILAYPPCGCAWIASANEISTTIDETTRSRKNGLISFSCASEAETGTYNL